ncbi:MAG: hypothetical protein ACPHCJ_05595, partial [Oceanococcaceae bacterium]
MSFPRIEYTLQAQSPQAQQLMVEIRCPLPESGQLQLRFANWTPGSYKMRDYARHVLACRAWIDEKECQPS